jgi:hypothetical protein
MLAFPLHALAAELPSQEWHDAAHEKLSTWNVEYMDVLQDIPEKILNDPSPFVYQSSWESFRRPYTTRSRSRKPVNQRGS